MRRIILTTLLAAPLLAAADDAMAQTRPCPGGEGRTSAGICANPDLMARARRDAVVRTQPKLSYSAPPVLPGLDRRYRYPYEIIRDKREDFERDFGIREGSPSFTTRTTTSSSTTTVPSTTVVPSTTTTTVPATTTTSTTTAVPAGSASTAAFLATLSSGGTTTSSFVAPR